MSCTAWNEWTKSDKIGVKKKERKEESKKERKEEIKEGRKNERIQKKEWKKERN